MTRKGRRWIDPKNSTKFRLVHRSYADPRYGDADSNVRILTPVENPNIARKRLPDKYYEDQEKIIDLIESYNEASTGASAAHEGDDVDLGRLLAAPRPKQEVQRTTAHDEDDEDDEDDDEAGRYDDGEEDEEEEEGGAHRASATARKGKAVADEDDEDDLDRFADADEEDEDEDEDDMPPLEEDEDRKKSSTSAATKKDVKPSATKSKKGTAEDYELGEYGFDSSYNYAQHFKPMGNVGGVFMEAPVPKGGKKGVKPAGFVLREDEEKEKRGKILTTEIVDFLDDADVPADIPDDVLAALNDPEAFEQLTDDFVAAAETEGGEAGDQTGKKKKAPQRRVRFAGEDEDDEEDGELYDEEDDEDDEDLDALLHSLKANPNGNNRRERNEYEQLFDARFEQALADFDDDDIGELEHESDQIKGTVDVAQLKPVLREFIQSRRRVVRGRIVDIVGDSDSDDDAASAQHQKADVDDDKDETKSLGGMSQRSRLSAYILARHGQESDSDKEYAPEEEPRDQWDCESITTTYTNTENHPALIDDMPARTRRQPPIVLSKKTGIPLGVLPTTPAKAKKPEEAANQGQARPKEETKEEKRARKQQIKEARKVNRERKKELKGAFKEEEMRQLSRQAQGQGRRVIRLK